MAIGGQVRAGPSIPRFFDRAHRTATHKSAKDLCFSASRDSLGSRIGNPRPEIDVLPNEFQALNHQIGQLVANAEHYLRAVAVRNRRAKKYAEDLARAVLALDVVVLAKDVLHGGVRRYSSATRLVEAILLAAGRTPAARTAVGAEDETPENGDG
jgi:hypothetical protein